MPFLPPLQVVHDSPDVMQCPNVVGANLCLVLCSFVFEIAPSLVFGQFIQSFTLSRYSVIFGLYSQRTSP